MVAADYAATGVIANTFASEARTFEALTFVFAHSDNASMSTCDMHGTNSTQSIPFIPATVSHSLCNKCEMIGGLLR